MTEQLLATKGPVRKFADALISNRNRYDGTQHMNSNEVSEMHGRWIGDPDPTPDVKIEHIYFIYVRIQNNNRQHLYVRQYYAKLTDVDQSGNIEVVEEKLMKNARRSHRIRDFEPIGSNFSDDMGYVNSDCYFTILIDERDWRFNPETSDVSRLDDFIVFRKNKIEYDGGEYFICNYHENDAFYGLTRNPISDPDDGTKRDCIRCVFRSNGPYWDESGNIVKQYGLDIYVKAPFFNDGELPKNWLTIVFDPKVPSEGPPSQPFVPL